MENTEEKKHDDEETSYARIEPYTNPAGGWGALLSVARNLKRQEVFKKGAITLLNINQPTGFDCPGCAWPEKKMHMPLTFVKTVRKPLPLKPLQNVLRLIFLQPIRSVGCLSKVISCLKIQAV